MNRNSNATTVDEFITRYPGDVQEILMKIRTLIKQAVPEAKEIINYGIPTFTLNDKNLVHYSAYEKHIGFYPGPKNIEAFRDKVASYETSKGTIKFSLDKPIPYDLIVEITLHASK